MALKDDYLKAYPKCQYTAACGRYVNFGRHINYAPEVDHIWVRALGPKTETWSNYATATPAAHAWKHNNLVVAKIAIHWFKWDLARRMGETDETELRHFDVDELRAACGMWVPGWIENKVTTIDMLPGWCCEMALALLEGCNGT